MKYQASLFLENKIDNSVSAIKELCPPEGFFLCFSGGKDSIVLYELALMAGIKFESHFHFTSVDPPEILQFIRANYPEVIWDRPKDNMWKLIVKAGIPPLRHMRYCCEYLKECHGIGRILLLGIRKQESNRRSKRGVVENCMRHHKIFVHPILDWTHDEVWQFIEMKKLKYCELYDKGFKRIGCVLCPMTSRNIRLKEAEMYPGYYKAYIRAFDKMIEERARKRKQTSLSWKTGEEVMDWWLSK